MTATAQSNDISATTAVVAGTLSANTLFINAVAIDATTGITAGDGTGALRAAINSKTSLTGVTAAVNASGALVLQAGDGRNISVTQTTTAAGISQLNGGSAGVTVFRSNIKFVSNNSVTFVGTTTDLGNLNTNTPFNPDLNNALSLLDISTQTGATTAITSLDAALQQVNQLRSDVGALSNRLELTVQAITVAAENQEAAASRIKDADFAFETAVLTRNQILVQAGTAILAQANLTPQIALQLLQA